MNTSNNLHKGMKGETGNYDQSGFVGKQTHNSHKQTISLGSIVIFIILLVAIVTFALFVTGMV